MNEVSSPMPKQQRFQQAIQRKVFVHLSDIHFRRRREDTIYSVDEDVRNELEIDCTTMGRRLAPIEGIVVTGDVAYSGIADQYATALAWLRQLSCALGCPPEAVWTTPGNHDVDRTKWDGPMLRAIHDQLRTADLLRLDGILEQYLRNDVDCAALLAPAREYLEFASKFGCTPRPGSLHWEDDIALNDGSRLRLRGLNSALISSSVDDSAAQRLALGSVQYTLRREDGVTYMVLCHHPPDWLKDGDGLEDVLVSRAHLHLFGHKHRQRLVKINESLRISAGALNPDRREPDWVPRYNLLGVSVEGRDNQRQLRVDVYPRIWNSAERKFEPQFTGYGSDEHTYRLRLPGWSPPVEAASLERASLECHSMEAAIGLNPTAEPLAGSPAMATLDAGRHAVNTQRRLTYQFLTLPYHVRLEVAQKLALIHDEDKGIADAELFKRLFRRARDGGLIEKLIQEVESRHTGGGING